MTEQPRGPTQEREPSRSGAIQFAWTAGSAAGSPGSPRGTLSAGGKAGSEPP